MFDAINEGLLGIVVGLTNFLTTVPWPLVVIFTIALAYFLSGRKISTTVLVTVCMFFIGFLSSKFWDKSVQTLGVMVISILICVVIGIPVAIAMSRNPRFRNAILPILDLMQTIPSFCYLIPGIMLFGLGAVPAIIATVIYAAPPLIRLEMQRQLIELQKEMRKTIVFITHDLDEALRLGDEIAILNGGRLVQVGKPEDIVLKPADDYVAAFVADVNKSRVLRAKTILAGLADFKHGKP